MKKKELSILQLLKAGSTGVTEYYEMFYHRMRRISSHRTDSPPDCHGSAPGLVRM